MGGPKAPAGVAVEPVPDAGSMGNTATDPEQGAASEQVASGWKVSTTNRFDPLTAMASGYIPGVFTVFRG